MFRAPICTQSAYCSTRSNVSTSTASVTIPKPVSARASLAETKARIKEADLNLRRIAELAKNNISAQADLDHAEADSAALNARLAQQETEIIVADRTVATWQQQLEDTVVRAPYSGIVTTKNAQAGEMISPLSAGGQFTRTGICTIVDMSSLEIEVDVNESYINRVKDNQHVTAVLNAYPEWSIPALDPWAVFPTGCAATAKARTLSISSSPFQSVTGRAE